MNAVDNAMDRLLMRRMLWVLFGRGLVVHWTDGILQHSTNVLSTNSAFVDVPGASPTTYITSVTNAARFYRLRCNSP